MAPLLNMIQTSFAAGEIAPSLYARVDLAKYHIAAKLLRNMFVWVHGGASNRAGTMFVGRCWNSNPAVGCPINPMTNLPYAAQLIPFQFNLVQTYILEFGHQYMRVIMNGGYVLEPAKAISAITKANPGVLVVGNHGYKNGDQVFITMAHSGGMQQINSTPGKQYIVQNATESRFTLTDLDGNVINTTNYNTFFVGSIARVFTLTTPYAGSDIQAIKWTQSADTLTLCHPSYPPADLTRTQHWVWTLTTLSFAPTISAPTGVNFVNSAGTSGYTDTKWNYSYVVTAVSASPPDESYASAPKSGTGVQLNSDAGAYNTITWSNLTAASYYRVYKANPTYNQAIIPADVMYGYIGTANGTSFTDTEIAPDFTQSPPQGTNPFNEGPIASVKVLTGGSGYDSTTQIVATDLTGTGAVLTPTIVSGVITAVTVTNGGQNYQNPTVQAANQGAGATGYLSVVANPLGQDVITAVVTNGGSNYFGKVTVTASGGGTGCTFTPKITNGVITSISVGGFSTTYTNGETLVFTQAGGSGATFQAAVAPSGNFPSCATYFQQRKVFAGSLQNPQTIWMTQPADFKNMDVSNPSQASDAIVMTIAANQVNAIKWLVPMNNLVCLTAGGAWLLVGGAITSPIAVTPTNTVVVPQNYVGCADLPPIVINYDILYVQAKGSIIRDLAYNFWVNVYTGTDMSVLANHLFFGHNMERWAYAEQPFYQVWVVRDDGILLSFTYLKEQDVYAWAHHDSFGSSGTDQFLSVASIPEQQIPGINMDSVYFVTQRTIPGVNGGQPVQYVERMNGRNFLTNGVSDVTKAWFVDCGLQYNSSDGGPTTTVSGLDHLNGATVSILADGNVQPQQTVVSGQIVLQYAAQTVTVGLKYVAQLQTLCMEPEGMTTQVQDYRKKISAVAVRVTDTRGLKVGPNFNDLTEIKERSSVVSMGTAIPLFTGDERVVIDNQYLVDDDVCIEQDNPLPCTILGVIPEVTIGDSPG